MDVRKLRKIIELLTEFDVADFKLKDEESSVQIIRKYPLVQSHNQNSSTSAQSNHSIEANSNFGADDEKTANLTFANKGQKEQSPSNSHSLNDEKNIKSPMVGTFYSASSPDSEDFIKIGQKIEAGDMICIIEAMKIMNRIESDRAGIVKDILVQNGEPVQFGQVLVVLE